MKKAILFVFNMILLINSVFAAQSCFIIKDEGGVIKREGDCKMRYSSCSTFKIALSLMGYDSHILKDERYPEWPFKSEYEAYLESWKDPQNPMSWIKNSCV
jgi:beta-lactamase class D